MIALAVTFAVLSAEPAAPIERTVPAVAQAHPLDPDAATRAYLALMTPEQKAKSDAYFEGGYWLILWNFLFNALIYLALLHFGVAAKMRDWAAHAFRWRWGQPALFWAQFAIVTTVLSFPLGVYQGYFREHAYGLATQGFGSWLADQGKGLALTVVLGGLALVAIYAVLRRAPRAWWLWGTGVATLFVAFAVMITPVFVAPLFNTYTPVTDARIRDPILRLARANGIQAKDIYEADESKQSSRVSANVSGLFGTERVSLNDNLIKRGDLDQIEAVMGHEMGHYVLNHIPKLVVGMGLLIGLAFAFVQWAFGRLAEIARGRWRVESVGDPAGLPLLMLLFSAAFFVLTPAVNTLVRTQEIEADLFGLNAVQRPDAFAQVALSLSAYRKMDPGKWEEILFYDHPSGRTRIHTAMQWKAAHVEDAPQATAQP